MDRNLMEGRSVLIFPSPRMHTRPLQECTWENPLNFRANHLTLDMNDHHMVETVTATGPGQDLGPTRHVVTNSGSASAYL